jgi:uncharacterized protein YbcI
MESLGSINTIAAGRQGVRSNANGARGGLRTWISSRMRERRSRRLPAMRAGRSRWHLVRAGRKELVARRGRSDWRQLALPGAEPEAAISALVGGVVSEHTGPRSKARTYLNGEVITVVLTDTLTKGEERLVRDGMSELVLGTRRAFQQTIRQDLVAGIEEITGRRVRVSASEMRPEVTVEVLVLDSPSEGEPVRGERQPL